MSEPTGSQSPPRDVDASRGTGLWRDRQRGAQADPVVGQDLVVDEILQAASTRLPDLDLQVQLGTTVQNILALNRRMLDVVYGFLPFESPETPRYLPLGAVELVLAIPEGHRLASTQWVPREELRNEPLILG